VSKRLLQLEVDEAELERRRAAWVAPPAHYARGFGAMYSKHVTQADQGCDFDFLHHGPQTAEPQIHH
jgi:dihydroxy-acid dehydratase